MYLVVSDKIGAVSEELALMRILQKYCALFAPPIAYIKKSSDIQYQEILWYKYGVYFANLIVNDLIYFEWLSTWTCRSFAIWMQCLGIAANGLLFEKLAASWKGEWKDRYYELRANFSLCLMTSNLISCKLWTLSLICCCSLYRQI